MTEQNQPDKLMAVIEEGDFSKVIKFKTIDNPVYLEEAFYIIHKMRKAMGIKGEAAEGSPLKEREDIDEYLKNHATPEALNAAFRTKSERERFRAKSLEQGSTIKPSSIYR